MGRSRDLQGTQAMFIEADFSSRPTETLAVDGVAYSVLAADQTPGGPGPNIFHPLNESAQPLQGESTGAGAETVTVTSDTASGGLPDSSGPNIFHTLNTTAADLAADPTGSEGDLFVLATDMAADQSLDDSGPNIFHHLSNQVYSAFNSGWICDV